jgi:hypothetical protein
MNAGAKNPNRATDALPVFGCELVRCVGDYGGQKRLGRLDDVRKLYRPLGVFYRTKLPHDRFARRDTVQ